MPVKSIFCLFLICFFTLCLSGTGNAAAPDESAMVVVSREAGYDVLLDTSTVRYDQGISGRSYVESWFEFRYTGRAVNPQAILDRFGVDVPESVQRIRQHYLFFLPASAEDPRILGMGLNVELYGPGGNRVYRNLGESAPAGKWNTLDPVEEKIIKRLLEDLLLQDRNSIDPRLIAALPYKRANEGFLGLRWGMKPDQVRQISYLSSPNARIDIYQTAGYDVRPILGNVQIATGLQLIFDRSEGLVQGRIAIPDNEVRRVERHLFDKLGHPAIFEMTPEGFAKTGPFWLWSIGEESRVVFYTGNQHKPRVEIRKPGFAGDSGISE